jgi:citrate synthase
MQERLKALKKGHGSKSLGEVTVDMCIGGMRGIPVSGALARCCS